MENYESSKRNYEYNFLDTDNNSIRFLHVDCKAKMPEDTVFKKGFEFVRMPSDKKCVPQEFINYEDFYGRYFMNLLESKKIIRFVDEVKRFFEPKGISNIGCRLDSQNGNYNSLHYDYTEFDQQYISPKIRERPRKGVEAIEFIDEDEFIIKEKPLILCKPPPCVCTNYYYFECSYCTKSGCKYYVCHTCNCTIYCSRECRETAFQEYHKYECRANKCHFFGTKNTLWVAFRMLMLGTHFKFDSKSKNKYRDICQITDHKRNLHQSRVLRETTLVLVYLKMYTKYFTSEEVTGHFRNMGDDQVMMAIGGILLKHIVQAHNATFYFPEEAVSLISYTRGSSFATGALCLKASQITHSCTPNAALVMRDNYYYVKAIRKISPDESITINYLHLDASFYGSGKKCKCLECVTKKYYGKMYTCFNCGGSTLELYYDHYDAHMWRCRRCNIFKANNDMVYRMRTLSNIFKRIKGLDSKNYLDYGYICNVYIEMYFDVYSRLYPEYLFVLQKAFILAVEANNISHAQHYSEMIFKALTGLNNYSFQKVNTLTSMVNCICITVFKNEVELRRMLKIAKAAMNILSPICDFYILRRQFLQLKELIKNVEKHYSHFQPTIIYETRKVDYINTL